MADYCILSVLLAFFLISVVHGGEWCTDHSTDLFDSETFWCEHGCCGSHYDRYCCIGGQAGMIVGIVIGSLIFVGLVVSVIVACCCCMRKSRGRAGQVVSTTGTAVPMATVQTPYIQQPYIQQPPAYPPGGYQPMGYQQPPPQPQPQPLHPGMQPGNTNQGFDPPKYSDVVNSH